MMSIERSLNTPFFKRVRLRYVRLRKEVCCEKYLAVMDGTEYIYDDFYIGDVSV